MTQCEPDPGRASACNPPNLRDIMAATVPPVEVADLADLRYCRQSHCELDG